MLSLTCEDMYAGELATIETNLKRHNIPEEDYGHWISQCIDYVTHCGCDAEYKAGLYGNLCMKVPECTSPCTCDNRDGLLEVMIESSKIRLLYKLDPWGIYDGITMLRSNFWIYLEVTNRFDISCITVP